MTQAPTYQPEAVIQVNNLVKSFGSNQVLRDLSFYLSKGENLVVLGKSGSGKSVLIKCIIGLIQPDSGSISAFNQQLIGLPHEELDKLRAKIGFLFQSNALYDSMSVRENLEFPLRRHKQAGWANVNELVMEALNNVGLANTIDMLPDELSGGMRKRIALARALILKPEIILYDEPTTGLDPVTGRDICRLMLDIQQKYNTSSIIISHDMNCVRITANRIIVLLDGKCYATGTYNELKQSSDKNIKQFFD